MKRIYLTMKYEEQYKVIKDLIDHNGNKHRAAKKLGISVRQVNRRIKQYQDKGKAAFVHGNKDRKPVNCLTTEINNQIVTLYRSKYQDCNLKHFVELLENLEDIHVSYTKVYTLLKKQDILSPKPWKKTKRALAKKRWRTQHPKQTKEEVEVAVNHQLAVADAHPRHERCKYFGEEIQMDASVLVWFGTQRAYLHLAIDNATGIIVGAYFDWQETLNGYYHVFKQILQNYGIPLCFKTDNRTVFNYETAKTKSAHKDVLTQFGYACKTLGVDLKTTSISQAKGMVERANQTVQSRLKPELRLASVKTIEEANKYLIEQFVPNFNKKFGNKTRKGWSIFEVAPSERKINYTLAVLSGRVFDSGSAISFKNKLYQAVDEYGKLICFMKGTKCLVIEALNGQLLATVDDHVYLLKEIPKNAKISPEIDQEPKKKRAGRKYIPPMSHPWKRESFLRQQAKAHKYHQYT
ncbi:ISNCY family transposase [Lactobacillus gasseri]|nr:ISNCY family transposase [Lactobacillus gasseri]MCZ3670335.1 ISNCY family transposase [Lactobacillus gasseri]MDX5066772.1 ISNCY family transposase [Lactobacillus gasseri]MDX5083473.1 ISNCY family transposase [Lactobacillus gasseri]